MKNKIKTILILSIVTTLVTLSSCVPLVAGAAGGYMLKEEGYDVRSPITRD